MLNLNTLIQLTNNENSVVGQSADQAVVIAQKLESNLITKEEAQELVADIASQIQITIDSDAIELKAVIDSAIADLLTAISALPIP